MDSSISSSRRIRAVFRSPLLRYFGETEIGMNKVNSVRELNVYHGAFELQQAIFNLSKTFRRRRLTRSRIKSDAHPVQLEQI